MSPSLSTKPSSRPDRRRVRTTTRPIPLKGLQTGIFDQKPQIELQNPLFGKHFRVHRRNELPFYIDFLRTTVRHSARELVELVKNEGCTTIVDQERIQRRTGEGLKVVASAHGIREEDLGRLFLHRRQSHIALRLADRKRAQVAGNACVAGDRGLRKAMDDVREVPAEAELLEADLDGLSAAATLMRIRGEADGILGGLE